MDHPPIYGYIILIYTSKVLTNNYYSMQYYTLDIRMVLIGITDTSKFYGVRKQTINNYNLKIIELQMLLISMSSTTFSTLTHLCHST